uniref:IBH1-like N-terminal domain-containing protein n=1 Tax=Picea sitchensis TaxID=3332 RepID=D5AE18_PICSI|nr:unknown [Picea sitchensis]
MLAMEGKCSNMSRVRVYLTHLLPELQKIRRRRSSLSQRQRAIRFAADMCLARTANNGSAWTRALNLRLMRKEKTMKMKKSSLRRSLIIKLARKMRLASLDPKCRNNVDLESGGHDHGAIDRRFWTLQRVVPGGRKMGVDTLFQETADYILNLQMQVRGMEALADFYAANSAGPVDESASCAAQV